MISVEVVYAERARQCVIEVRVPAGSRIRDAIVQSDIASDWPEIDIESADVGIFGKLATLDTILSPGDRIEIYRPLITDPKEARRLRAKKK